MQSARVQHSRKVLALPTSALALYIFGVNCVEGSQSKMLCIKVKCFEPTCFASSNCSGYFLQWYFLLFLLGRFSWMFKLEVGYDHTDQGSLSVPTNRPTMRLHWHLFHNQILVYYFPSTCSDWLYWAFLWHQLGQCESMSDTWPCAGFLLVCPLFSIQWIIR